MFGADRAGILAQLGDGQRVLREKLRRPSAMLTYSTLTRSLAISRRNKIIR